MSIKVKNIICVVLFIIIVLGMIIGFVKALNPSVPEVDSWYKYKVHPGDTLWDVVPEKDGYDIRVLINVVKEYNNLNSSGLIAGDVIELPVWKED